MSQAVHHRGVALLLVLAAVVLVSSAAVAAMRWRVIARASDLEGIDLEMCHALMIASEDIIETWLQEESRFVVLPSDAVHPGLVAFQARAGDWSLTITAWDTLGMAPAHHEPLLSTAESLTGVAASWLSELPENGTLGWDNVWRMNSGSLEVFPSFEDKSSEDQTTLAAVIALPKKTSGVRGPRSRSTRSQDRQVRINVQTAPMWLLEAAMESAGRGGLDAIMNARDRGERSPLPAADGSASDGSIRFVSSSDRWSFRVDARSGRIMQSYWMTYQSAGGWELRERYVVPE